MRPYATVSPLFWTGSTGKRLRASPDSQRIALYLMTSPHSHQSGIFYLPMMYLCHEIGISPEGASKGLIHLRDESFCEYDTESEWVWVREMAAWQIGVRLSENDKRCKGMQQFITTIPGLPFLERLIERYAEDFHLGTPDRSPLQGATEGASSEQIRTGTEQNRPVTARKRADVDSKITGERGTRIPLPFPVDDDMRAWAAKETPNVDVKAATAEFEDYWKAVPGVK